MSKPELAAAKGPGAAAPAAANRPAPGRHDPPVVGHEQALASPVTGTVCEAIACLDVGCTAHQADLDTGRAA